VVHASAEEIPEADHRVDLVVSMQALHFFNVEKHCVAAARVLPEGGGFAAPAWWGMKLPRVVSSACNPVFK
jgi:ubiquinone/menaquinone biosynthesis C-methylase UbiE